MSLTRQNTLLLAAPAVGVVAILVMAYVLPIGALAGVNKIGEQLRPHGYVTVSVFRDGQEIYHYEDHNLITEVGMDFIADQIGNTPGTAAANWIALSSDSTAPAAGDTTLQGEITTGGLQRAQGTFTQGTGGERDTWTISKTFNANGTHTDVRKAGLFTAGVTGTPGNGNDDGIMVAENTFSGVNLASGDTLTITWKIDLGIL